MSEKLMEIEAAAYKVLVQEVVKNMSAPIDEISQRTKAAVDNLLRENGIMQGLPLDYAKNLVRLKLKEIELECNLGDPNGKDDEIRKEILQIREDIENTKPHSAVANILIGFKVADTSFSKN